MGTYQIKVLHKKFKRKKNHAQERTMIKKFKHAFSLNFLYEQVFKNTRKNRSGGSGADIYNHPPKVAQINLQ